MKHNCFSCDRELEQFEWSDSDPHPSDGLHFRTYGHYGSTVFDPMDGSKFLDIVICDLCILENLNRAMGTGVESIEKNKESHMKIAKECLDAQ